MIPQSAATRMAALLRHMAIAGVMFLAAVTRADPLTLTQVAAAVEKLGSDRLADRREAEKLLLDAGPMVLDRIPEPEEVRDAAVRDALLRIRQSLEAAAAEAAMRPSRVTFRGRATLAELLQQVERQTGNVVSCNALTNDVNPVSPDVDWDDITFWESVTRLANQAELKIEVGSQLHTVNLSSKQRSADAESECQSIAALRNDSAFLVRVCELTDAPEHVRQGEPMVRLRFEVLAEPRLRPLFLGVRDDAIQVYRDGEALRAFSPLSAREIEFTSAGKAVFDVSYLGIRDDLSKPFEVRGEFDVELVGLSRTLQFAEWGEQSPIVRRRGDLTVSLDRVRANGADTAAEAQLTLRYAAGGPSFESHRIGSILPNAVLRLPDGNQIRSQPNPELTREQAGTLGAKYRFSELPAAWRSGKLEYTVPISIVRTRVRFSPVRPPSVPPR